jgi:hypothetical protein
MRTAKPTATAKREPKRTTEASRGHVVSLKAFHVFFIALSVLMSFGVSGWNASAYSQSGGTAFLVQAIFWGVTGVGLIVYGVLFLRKYKRLRYI